MGFADKSYWEQKGLLKAFYDDESDVSGIVDLLSEEVQIKLSDPIIPQLTDKEVIKSFLIGGKLSFAREGDGYHREKRPDDLEIKINKNNNIVWNEWAWKDVIHTYKLNEIIYITHFTDDLSFLHTLYNGKLNFYNKELVLEEYVDSIVDVLSNYFLDINKVLKVTNDIKRAYKLQKIMTNGQI